jgi:hypothetical protein
MPVPLPEMVPQSFATVRIGKHVYPVKSQHGCRVCMSPHRFAIERELAYGHSYQAVHDSLEKLDPPPPTPESMARHVVGNHMPLQQTSQRLMIERRAAEMGRSIEAGAESLLDYVSVNEQIIQRGFQRLTDGEIQPNMSDLLQALKLQTQIDAATPSGSIDNEVWMEAMMEYLAIAKKVMPPDMWARFGLELASSPVMKAIQAQMSGPVTGEVMRDE